MRAGQTQLKLCPHQGAQSHGVWTQQAAPVSGNRVHQEPQTWQVVRKVQRLSREPTWEQRRWGHGHKCEVKCLNEPNWKNFKQCHFISWFRWNRWELVASSQMLGLDFSSALWLYIFVCFTLFYVESIKEQKAVFQSCNVHMLSIYLNIIRV